MSINDSLYIFTASDQSRWAVAIGIIAYNRAMYYLGAEEFKTEEEALADTWETFASEPDMIGDWARGNMDWADVQSYCMRLRGPEDLNFQEEWVNPQDTFIYDQPKVNFLLLNYKQMKLVTKRHK